VAPWRVECCRTAGLGRVGSTKSSDAAGARLEPLTFALIDLDDFTLLNDTCGHAAGDRLLKLVAARWLGQLRAVDVLARIGGDEFYLLLPRGAGRRVRRAC